MKKIVFLISIILCLIFIVTSFYFYSESKTMEKWLYEVSTYNNQYVDKDLLISIHNDLMENSNLIPHKGILGGTPNFYSENRIILLKNNIVVAYWEDGHVGGFVILQYKISTDGNFEWKRLKSFRDY